MAHPLLDVDHLGLDPELYLQGVGEVFATFRQQDSGCYALGLALAGERWFVKFSAESRAVPSLERAAALHREVTHPSIIPLRRVMRTHPASRSSTRGWRVRCFTARRPLVLRNV